MFYLRQLVRSVLVITCALGCTRSSNPHACQAVSGTVILDGSPLSEGEITFIPQEPGPVISGASIISGKFSLPQARGLPAGEYRVTINSFIFGLGAGEPAADPGDGMVMDDSRVTQSVIPARYNEQTTLTARVVSDAPNEFLFDLTSR